MPDHKPRIVIDFDGVLHSYTSGWKGEVEIPDPPTPGAVEFVEFLLRNDWEVVVCSTRAATSRGRAAIALWLQDHDFPVEAGGIREITHGKPPALVYLDDRALRFDGVWPDLVQIEAAAIPWNKCICPSHAGRVSPVDEYGYGRYIVTAVVWVCAGLILMPRDT